MGVDTKLILPAEVAVRRVAEAIALLLGVPKTWTALGPNNDIWRTGLDKPTDHGWIEVKGITYQTNDTQPECCTINIEGIKPEYGNGWWFFYHFESENGKRCMIGGSRAERIALHRRLVMLFGGSVDYQDCDSKSVDFSRKAPSWVGKANNDNHFHRMQMALWELKPITREEIEKCEEWAAYKKD